MLERSNPLGRRRHVASIAVGHWAGGDARKGMDCLICQW